VTEKKKNNLKTPIHPSLTHPLNNQSKKEIEILVTKQAILRATKDFALQTQIGWIDKVSRKVA